MGLGVYISVPFCRSKCSYCNFASGVFSAAQMGRYIERVCADIQSCRDVAASHKAAVPDKIDSIYLGGGTPSLLPPDELTQLFAALADQFQISRDAEITVECAPATLNEPVLKSLVACGVSRVSLGVQSFVDKEAASVARLHTREQVLNDIENLRATGISNINIDLIAGLPHQTRASWEYSLQEAIATQVPHVSVYMLEIDEDSRLGRELIAGGARYHAHFVPDDDLTAEFYETACAQLAASGVEQYEISNFAHSRFESRHNLKYWTRHPYIGFGVDAHSMLPAPNTEAESVRLATTDSYDDFFVSPHIKAVPVSREEALEESFFLELRLNRGIKLRNLHRKFGNLAEPYSPVIEELAAAGMLSQIEDTIRLTPRGRLLSNEVFEKFIGREALST